MSVAQSIPEAKVISWPSSARTKPSASIFEGFDAIVLGPGMEESASLSATARALLRKDTALIVDAGALTALGGANSSAGAPCIVTPHAGEMASLTKLDRALRRIARSGSRGRLRAPPGASSWRSRVRHLHRGSKRQFVDPRPRQRGARGLRIGRRAGRHHWRPRRARRELRAGRRVGRRAPRAGG